MGRGVRRFTQLRAWQACYAYKKAVYGVCERSAFAQDVSRRVQLERSVAGPPAQLAEGYGRFNPVDFANFARMARASLMESQNHLLDAVDKGYITEETRQQLEALAEAALEEVTGLMEYLQSPEALRNARRVRERRAASRPERRASRLEREGSEIGEDDATNPEPGTPNPEPRTRNPEPGTRNPEPRTRTPKVNTNREPRTQKRE